MASLSVVIPALNDAAMLKTALEALAAQTRPADEIVVVDNGSTDDTAAVGRAGGARVVSQPVRGIYPATSTGYDEARGDVIVRIDADSVPPADWLAKIEARMATLDGRTAVTGPGDFYGSNALVRWLGDKLYIGGMWWACTPVLGHPPLFGSNFAMPAALWRRLRETANRDVANIHDDLDLSYHFEPDMNIVVDFEVRVGISARPFASPKALGRRLWWVYTTCRLNFRQQPPFARLRARREWAEAQAAGEDPEPEGLTA